MHSSQLQHFNEETAIITIKISKANACEYSLMKLNNEKQNIAFIVMQLLLIFKPIKFNHYKKLRENIVTEASFDT